ncbi:MAG: hypothetical protein D0531_08675 [Methylococcales bacterium]|nr:MAG: hypothetical protein D0531_08675 [Methylococcales bacterium]
MESWVALAVTRHTTTLCPQFRFFVSEDTNTVGAYCIRPFIDGSKVWDVFNRAYAIRPYGHHKNINFKGASEDKMLKCFTLPLTLRRKPLKSCKIALF